MIKLLSAIATILLLQLPSIAQQKKYAADNKWKLSPHIANQAATKKSLQTYIISTADSASLYLLLQTFKKELSVVIINIPSNSAVIKCTASFVLQQLINRKEVIFIDAYVKPQTEISIIGYDRSFHGINAVDYNIPGANGKNIVAGVKEQKMEVADLDIYKRVLPSSLAAVTTDNHATVISSIIGGAGNSFYDGRGIANECNFFSSSFSNLFPDDISILNANKVSVQNHSYGTVIQQFYGAEAVSYDVQTWQNKNLLHVFSAGNRGTQFAADGKYANIAGYANLTGNFKTAKNIITVAAIDNKGNVAAESSAGPLYDGRIAPQITALGPNGTSDAAAVVSGTIAVMQQVYADSNSRQLPSASLIKAILYNTAADVFNKGIDYKTGYGLLNSYACVKAIQQKKYDGATVTQGQQWTKAITVPANAAQLKVTLAWTDTAATVNNIKALTNDLDIEVLHVSSGTVYKPWVLNAAANADSLSKQPVRKRDSLNTAEQVSVELPAAGTYQIKITGTVVTGQIPFNIAFNVDTLNTFAFISPQHANDVNREEVSNLAIKWKTFVADTNTTGNLFIGFNNGSNWQLIKQNHKIYSNQFLWPIKDTNSMAVLKMETGFGNFISPSFIISSVNRPLVDFVCADSFRLSWNKHVYASSYKIYTLTDSPYLKHLLTVSDSFAVFNRNISPTLVYAVEPILNNNLPAIRSIAFDVTLQGVKCFYKTFYYNLLDGNKLDMILELSFANYTDSIYFEEVTASGTVLKTYGGVKTNNLTSLYSYAASNLQAGTTYLRARIKLKTGAVVYTEIISVLTSGTKIILFYPNPVPLNNQLNYMLMQVVPADSQLQLFDAAGRLIAAYSSLPNNISIKKLPRGLVIYKLLNRENVVVETGKIIIQ